MLLKLQKEKLEKNVRMMLQVHDELVFEIEDDLVDAMIPKIKKYMEGVLSKKETHNVPLTVDVKVGANWKEMEDR